MAKERLVVIGGDAAGMSAASKARRENRTLEIVVFERSPHTSYSACGLPYYIGRVVEESEALIARTPEEFVSKYGIDARIRHEVTSIDPKGGRLRVLNRETQKETWESYDQLLIATGAVPYCPSTPDAGATGIYGLSTLESGILIRRVLDEEKPRRAVIVGGGYIGLEMAEALILRGLEVTLVQRGSQVMNTLDSDMGGIVSDTLRRKGVKLFLEESMTAFEVEGGRVRSIVTDRRTLPTDIVILGMGVRPRTDLAEAAGIPLGVKGSIRVNTRMQTEIDGIWAAGDCAESFHLVNRRPFYVALGTVANKQGLVAGTNLGGGYATFPGVVGTAVTKVCDCEVGRTGLQEKEVVASGLCFASAVITSRTRSGYYPGAEKVTVKMLAERGSGRLLGAQIVGGVGAAKRIDVVATALHAGFNVEEMVHLDLSYAPPYSPVWDPVQIAARQLVKEV